MRRRALTVSAVLAFAWLAGAGAAAAAEQEHFQITAQGWYPTLSGDGEYRGTDFDVENDLQADGEAWHYGLDFTARLGKHRIFAAYGNGTHDGDTPNAEVELTSGHALYGYSFVNMKYFDFGVLGGVDTYDLTTKGSGNDEVSLSATDLAVGVGLGFRLPVFPLSIRGWALYVPVEISGDDTKLTDAAVSFDFHVLVMDFQVGYRYYDLESENTDDRSRESYRFQGPFAGFGLRF